jgi:hypothetical protein
MQLKRKVSQELLKAVGVSQDDAKQMFLDAVKNTAETEVKKYLEESKAYVRAAQELSPRKVWRSKFYNTEVKKSLGLTAGNSPIQFPLSAALDNTLTLENVLDPISLSETADAFFADGLLRRGISDMIDFVLPDRVKVAVTVAKAWEENKGKLDPDVREEFKELENSQIAEYHLRISKIMENISFHDRLVKLIANGIVFGRNALFIERVTDTRFPKLGKPTSLALLNPLSIKRALIDNTVEHRYRFDGFKYDFGTTGNTDVTIPRTDLIPFFYDDWNIYKNTYYSGLTRIFSLVGLAHTNQLTNTYDMPEAMQNPYMGNNYVYVGSESNILVDQFTNSHQRGTIYHDKPALHVEAAQASGKILEIAQTRESNYETMCIILGIPLFLILEKAANFATAAISMQVFINGRIKRFATQIGDMIEEYFLLPTLCDMVKVEPEQFQKVYVNRVKAIMPTITLETKTDRIDNALKLWSAVPPLITDRVTFFKYIGEDQLAELAEPLDELEQQMQREDMRTDINEITGNEDQMTQVGRKLLTNFNVKASPSETGVKDTAKTKNLG